MWRTNFAPASLRGRVIFGKGNGMEELIKRLERVIQTGAPDKDGMHPISAEAVLEVVKGLSEHSTNLASLGTDCISRQQTINALEKWLHGLFGITEADGTATIFKTIRQLPPIQPAEPQIIRCKDCKYAEYIDDVQTLWCTECGNGRTVAPYDFCSYGEVRAV